MLVSGFSQYTLHEAVVTHVFTRVLFIETGKQNLETESALSMVEKKIPARNFVIEICDN